MPTPDRAPIERSTDDRNAGAVRAVLVGLSAAVLIAITAVFVAMRSDEPVVDLETVPDAEPRAAATSVPDAAMDPAPARSEIPTTDTGPTNAAIARLAGIVRTIDGQPVAGADVVLVELPDGDSFRMMEPDRLQAERVRRATSDAQGRFEVDRHDPTQPAWASAFHEGMVGRRAWIRASGEEAADAELVLELAEGRTLRGRVCGPDGALLVGAVVSVAQCWTASDYGTGSGFAVTDARGEFAVGVDEEGVACTLRVTAEPHGQDLFRGVPVDAFAELVWQPRATLRGRVAGMTAERAGTVAVTVRGELPDPPVPVFRTGMRPGLEFEATVDADGTYAVIGLQPGLTYEATLIGVAPEAPARKRFGLRGPRLSPATSDRFTPAPGEVVERDFALAAPIVVRGRVTTVASRRGVASARLEVKKDGTALWDAYRETGDDGAFELRLVAGDGVYTLRALPPSWVGGGAALERRLVAGETVEIDLELPEPVVIPFRVIDSSGAPVESVQTTLQVTSAEGRRASIGTSRRLDAEGRSRLELFDTVASARLEVRRFPHGPRTAMEFGPLAPGAVGTEQTVVLPDACDVVGIVQDADGVALVESMLRITARYDDGTADDHSLRTDRDGRFAVDGAFRAERATFTVRDDGRREGAVAGAPSPDGRIDLGVVVVR